MRVLIEIKGVGSQNIQKPDACINASHYWLEARLLIRDALGISIEEAKQAILIFTEGHSLDAEPTVLICVTIFHDGWIDVEKMEEVGKRMQILTSEYIPQTITECWVQHRKDAPLIVMQEEVGRQSR